ncbi:MAG: hypothetical protein Q4D85_11565 [Corynebacterium sp.]|uniref:hypothetical protein n=1 Tax=Corynebacterium sp. TaxID=1720 RepID=UPI0026DB5590|nr:hypothetical protein [Corynebacterium sp.]MDO5099373.1 hypothetical protein [Corynebacterium sp.]
MKTTHLTILIGLFLGTILAFGSFTDFILVALCGLFGGAAGLALEGRLDTRELLDRWRQ